ncbi:pentapeptide repeat-containing protein [Breoghania sp. JC706]|uniref:pentapeptide repeat-containing protein n=1 Tax=Breoghania sp. JC706 TaxID=3117732 RepID=UPI0030080D7A
MSKPEEAPPPPQKDEFHTGAAMIFGGFLTAAALGVVALLLSDIEWTWEYWGTSDGVFDRSAIFRNFGLTILGLLALGLGAWRSWTAQLQAQSSLRQAGYAAQQVDNAIEQRRIAVRGQQVERYQKGALMLESQHPTVRIAGILTLRELAVSDPEDTYALVTTLLSNFISGVLNTRPLAAPAFPGALPQDAEKALDALSFIKRTEHLEEIARSIAIQFDDTDFSRISLLGRDLSRMKFIRCNFNETAIHNADISECSFFAAKFNDAYIIDCNASLADFTLADFNSTNFRMVNISGAVFWDVKNINPDNIDVWCWSDNEPIGLPSTIPIKRYDAGPDGKNRERFERQLPNLFVRSRTPSDEYLLP